MEKVIVESRLQYRGGQSYLAMTGGNTCSRWQPLILVYEALLPSSRHGIALKPPINNGRRALDRGARRPRPRFPTKSVDSIVRTLCTEAPKALNVSRTPCVYPVCAPDTRQVRWRFASYLEHASPNDLISPPPTFIPPIATASPGTVNFRKSKSAGIKVHIYMYINV